MQEEGSEDSANNTQMPIRVSLDWRCSQSSAPLGSHCAQGIRTVQPGGHIGGGNVDVDAFEVPANCRVSGILIPGLGFNHSSGWYKFNNLQTAVLDFALCPL